MSSSFGFYVEELWSNAASIRHRVSQNVICEWKARYDGNWKSLMDRNHRPHHHPREHTALEILPIRRN